MMIKSVIALSVLGMLFIGCGEATQEKASLQKLEVLQVLKESKMYGSTSELDKVANSINASQGGK